MIIQQYSTNEVPKNWYQITNLIEKGFSIEMTRNNQAFAILVPIQNNKVSSFWQALQQFRQQVELSDFETNVDIFAGVRDKSLGREILL